MNRLQRQWQNGGWLSTALTPLGGLYGGAMWLRRALYRWHWRQPETLPLPVVVVGNLTVGGSGKTPLVIALVEALLAAGRRPAVVSRGYGRTSRGLQVVSAGDGRRIPAAESGDEPALLADRLPVPVVVAADRGAAVREAAALGADCVVADDGFQRLSLPRERAFLVVDGQRGFGNGRCLPAGPLREPLSALGEADAVVINGGEAPEGLAPQMHMTLAPRALVDIQGRAADQPLAWLQGRRVHAAAGIGDPERFFDTLAQAGAQVVRHAFADHHAYGASDLVLPDDAPLVVTEKDAVKMRELGVTGWALRVDAQLRPDPSPWLADLPGAPGSGVS